MTYNEFCLYMAVDFCLDRHDFLQRVTSDVLGKYIHARKRSRRLVVSKDKVDVGCLRTPCICSSEELRLAHVGHGKLRAS